MPDKSRALTWTELRVGVVVILSLVVLAFTILYIGGGGGSPLAPKYDIHALMTDVNGLKSGAPVRLGGVEVGTVTDVGFSEKYPGQVEVTMSIEREVQDRITSASRITLGSLGLLGEKAVDITPGPGGSPIADGGYVRAAARRPVQGPDGRRLRVHRPPAPHPLAHRRRRRPDRQGAARRRALQPDVGRGRAAADRDHQARVAVRAARAPGQRPRDGPAALLRRQRPGHDRLARGEGRGHPGGAHARRGDRAGPEGGHRRPGRGGAAPAEAARARRASSSPTTSSTRR